MKKIILVALTVLLLPIFTGCETREQKAARFSKEMHESIKEVNELTQKANELERLLEEYKKAGGKK